MCSVIIINIKFISIDFITLKYANLYRVAVTGYYNESLKSDIKYFIMSLAYSCRIFFKL